MVQPITNKASNTLSSSQDELVEIYNARRSRQKLSRVFEMPELNEPGSILSQAELEFFVEQGFLVKRGLLDSKLCKGAMDDIWQHLLAHVPIDSDSNWRPDPTNPSSWLNPQWAHMPAHPESGPYQGRWPIEHYGRFVKLHDIGDAQFILKLFAHDPIVRSVAESLLGHDLKPTTQTRGVYAVFPKVSEDDPDGQRHLTGASLGPHTDQVCQQLNACAYLEDVKPRNGGFTIYPGSHKIMHRAHRYEANWSPISSYEDLVTEVVDAIEPYEIVADKGSVIFWHGRCVHSVGIHIGRDIRWALFADFTHNRSTLNEDEHRALGQYEWFKDAKLFSRDWPVTHDMWRNWSLSGRNPTAGCEVGEY